MKYTLTALTPLLVGDGQKLSPIDYMVWKEQINVLDQNRIFKLLAKGSRLEGYLTQLRTVEKLDFASWGGFAQNYAARRIPFEHPSATAQWSQSRTEYLHIPTFATGVAGPYLPATALKGALRTAVASSRWTEETVKDLSKRIEERHLRRPGETAEAGTLTPLGVSLGDSEPIDYSSFKVYLARISALSGEEGKFQLAWKANPAFAEMARPGTRFVGDFKLLNRRRSTTPMTSVFDAANDRAVHLLQLHRRYAEAAGLDLLSANLAKLDDALTEAKAVKNTCLVCLGWGGGFLSKAGFIDTTNESYRNLLRRLPYYERAIRSGLPFPKTRRVLYQDGQPATLAGWAQLSVQ